MYNWWYKVRVVGMGKLFHGDEYTGSELVRIAIPRRVYHENHFRYIQNSLKDLIPHIKKIKGLRIVKEGDVMRHFNAELNYA